MAHHRSDDSEDALAFFAHDTGTLLSSLRLWVELLGAPGGQAKITPLRAGEKALALVDRLQELVDHLLDAHRLEHDLFEPERAQVDVVALIVAASARLSTPSVPVDVLGPEALIISGDPHLLARAFENLIANAIKHSSPGEPVLVELCERAGAVTIDVTNRGGRVPVAASAHLFQPFAAAGDGHGVGLGLYLVRRIVDAHQGEVLLDDAFAEGARFRVVLPSREPGPLEARPG